MGYTATCKHCGTEFHPFTRLAKFCGIRCRADSQRSERVRDGNAKCSRCGEWKPVDQFVRGPGGNPHSHCKPCNAEWFAERRGGRLKPYKPMEKLDPEVKRERKRVAQKAFRTGKGRDYVRVANRLRHQRQRAGGKMLDRFELGAMLCEQDWRCVYCGELMDRYHIDHKLPLARGGSNDKENLHATCPRCNLIKGMMTHEEFLVSKKRRVRQVA